MTQQSKISTQKMLLWIAMVSMIMLFAGLTSAYIVRQAEGNWLQFNLPFGFYISTAIIIISSIFMNMALSSAKKSKEFRVKSSEFGERNSQLPTNNSQLTVKTALSITFLLGIVFIVSQFFAWKTLYSQHVVFAGKDSNPAGSFLYVLTGLHLLHVLGGMIFLAVLLVKVSKEFRVKSSEFGEQNSQLLLSIELCATYWHFLGALWIYLFLFLLFIR